MKKHQISNSSKEKTQKVIKIIL